MLLRKHKHLLDLLAAAAYLINLNRLDYDNTTLVDCLFSRDDFDCSVVYTWDTDKSKAVIGGVTVPQTSREHFPENGSWILIGQPRERNVVRFSAAVFGEEHCVTTLKTAV